MYSKPATHNSAAVTKGETSASRKRESSAQMEHSLLSHSCRWGRKTQRVQAKARNTQRQQANQCLCVKVLVIVCTFFEKQL
jgi:hypothetical protein